jgi:3-oxoacyl-[acyl-carrier-protein] synthase I
MNPVVITPLPITASAAVTACGIGNRNLLQALLTGTSRLRPLSQFTSELPVYCGEVDNDLLPELDAELWKFNTRNAQIALAAIDSEEGELRHSIRRAVERYGASRIGIVLGSSTSGIYETENAYISLTMDGRTPTSYHFDHQHIWAATAHYLQAELELTGPCYAVSTACSSSSKTIASAQRLILSGVCDAVLTGGVDSLCRMTLQGFRSLELVSDKPCTPLDKERSGISLGEGAGLLLLERPQERFNNCIHLLASGESSDAHHMTAPHPDGHGAVLAMERALLQGSLTTADIDYINLHATGTIKNDEAEMRAMETVFPADTPCSGTKGLTGHTLGAAGGVEAIIALLSLQHGFLPGTCGLKQVDPVFSSKVLKKSLSGRQVMRVMSNNFGFGGNNTSLILGKLHD